MKQQSSLSRQRGIGVVVTIVLALVVGIGLIAGLYWWSTRPASEAPAGAVATAPSAITEQPAAPVVPVGDPEELAEKAMQEKRMFVPPGDNAFELYLRVADADPDNIQARNALGELFPYAVLFVEQRIAAGDAVDGERVVALMQRADAAAPALPRLTGALADLRTRQVKEEADTERRAADAAARQQAADAASTAAANPVATSAPATTAPPATTPDPAPAEPEPQPQPQPQPQPVASASPPTEQASSPQPQRPEQFSPLPSVVSSVQPEYPVRAARRRIQGSVELTFIVRPDGSVTDVVVVSSKPRGMFDGEAIAAMERWRFAPQQNPSRGRRVFDFKLN